MRVRVRFNRNIMGRRAGQVDWVEATPMVETLVRVGMLRWLDAPSTDWIEHEDDPAEEPYYDQLGTSEPELIIPSRDDDLESWLAFADDGNPWGDWPDDGDR